MNYRFSHFYSRLNLSSSFHTIPFSILSILVGLLSAGGVWLFKWLFEILRKSLFVDAASQVHWIVIIIPLVGGLLVGLIARFFIGEEKFHGTPDVMQSVALSGGRLRYKKMPIKTLAAALSIGTGASVGPEDPSVQIGANIGSMFGQFFHLSDDRIRTLVAAGAASAIAAAFNAPIAGVFFALEIILGEINGSALSMILVSAVSSSVLTQAISGTQPAFQIPAYAFNSVWELPLYLALGLLAGPISALYIKLLYRIQNLFKLWKIQAWIKPAIAGAIIGVVGYFLPQIFGVGYDTISNILTQGSYTIPLLFALLVAKLILTPVSIGGGFFGGVFAPSLFIGAALGSLLGSISTLVFPNMEINAPAFALVGMAAVLAGTVRAPLTSLLLLFEMTGDYHIILPLMFAVAVSLLMSQKMQPDSVYAMGLARHGIRINHGKDIEVLAGLTVGEVMLTNPETLDENIPASKAAEILSKKRRYGLPVINSNKELVGVLTLGDIEKAIEKEKMDEPVAAICTNTLMTTTPNEVLASALQRMSQGDYGRLPVVAADNPLKLVGMLRRSDVIHAYEIAIKKRTSQRHREQSIRLDRFTPSQVEVNDIIIETGSCMDGVLLSEASLPHECVIASVQRHSDVFIPRGDTELQAGDILVVVADNTVCSEVKQLCRKM